MEHDVKRRDRPDPRPGRREPGIRPAIRLTLWKEQKFFGPGVATLLHLIQEKGSIQAASEAMEMSYTKAWKILRRADRALGFSLLNTRVGGVKGGQSTLSDRAVDFLRRYDAVDRALRGCAEELFHRYFDNYPESCQAEAEKPGKSAP